MASYAWTARDRMNWVTVRLIMTIAHGVAAAAAEDGMVQFSRRTGSARAGLVREARLGRGLLPGCAQLHRRIAPAPAWPVRCVPQARRVGNSALAQRHPRAGARAPRLLRCQTPITQLGGEACHGKVAEDT